MNDEIKEKELNYLLEEIKDTTLDYVGTNGCKYQDLLREELNLLLDYITNLQQDNDDLKKKLDRRYYKNEYERIKEENERLKQTQVFIDTQDMEERYGEELYKDYLKEQLDDYKSRCEKAIEYLKYATPLRYQDLLNILQNGSDN